MLRRMPPGGGVEGKGEESAALALEPSPEAEAAAAALPETLDSPTAGPEPLTVAAAAAAAAAADAEDDPDEAMLAAPIGSAPIGSGPRGGPGARGTEDLPPEDTLPEHRIQAGCTAVVAVLQARPSRQISPHGLILPDLCAWLDTLCIWRYHVFCTWHSVCSVLVGCCKYYIS